jgi:hypothetical protein
MTSPVSDPAPRASVIADGVDLGDGVALINPTRQRLVLLNASAREIWTVLARNGSDLDARRHLRDIYGLDEPDAVAAVAQFHHAIDQWLDAAPPPGPPDDANRVGLVTDGAPHRTIRCQVGHAQVTFDGPAALVTSLTAPFASAPALAAAATCHIRIEERDGEVTLIADGRVHLTTSSLEELTGGAYQAILARTHDVAEWLAVIHGAAISRAGSGIVLAGASGSGKTTLAAWMSLHGYQVLTDDIAAVEAETGCVLPLPTALSVKPGSHDLVAPAFDSLSDLREVSRQRQAAFGRLAEGRQAWTPARVDLLVFPRYRPGATPKARRIDRLRAASLLFADRVHLGADLTPARVHRFMDWLGSIRCLEVDYESCADAVAAVEIHARNG